MNICAIGAAKQVKRFAIGGVLIEKAIVIKKPGIINIFFQNGLNIIAGQVRRKEVVIFCCKIELVVVKVEKRKL